MALKEKKLKIKSQNKLPDLAIYDLHKDYHYKTYWKNRQYEHLAEMFAINALLKRIKRSKKKLETLNILDLGAGFGRLAPVYCNKFDLSILGDYSFKELLDAKVYTQKKGCKKNKTKFVALNAYFLPFKNKSLDVVLSVRLMHHIEQPKAFLQEVYRVLKPGGFFILEVANKNHIKAIIRALLKLDFNFLLKRKARVKHDKQSSQGLVNEKQGYIFENYNIKYIKKLAQSAGFSIVAFRQVSILRSVFLKKVIPYKILAILDNFYQSISVILNKFNIFLTPSVFILLHKQTGQANGSIYYKNNKDFYEILQCPRHNVPLIKNKDILSCSKGCVYDVKKGVLDLRFPPIDV